MVTPFNPNSAIVTNDYDVMWPRTSGRGFCLDSAGVLKNVSWASGQVLVDGVPFFALGEQPAVIDISVDSADRPVICWQDQTFVGFVRFFDPVPNGYSIYNCGSLKSPAIQNAYKLSITDIALVYLIGEEVHYRCHSEKFVTDRRLGIATYRNIEKFGIGRGTNSLNVVGFRTS